MDKKRVILGRNSDYWRKYGWITVMLLNVLSLNVLITERAHSK